jgi:hypothetical protein
MTTAAMGMIVAHNSAHHRGELSQTAVKQRCAVRTKCYVQLSELSYCLHNVQKGDLDDPTPHTPGRNGAGTPSDKSDLMSPFWSIIDIPKSRIACVVKSWP